MDLRALTRTPTKRAFTVLTRGKSFPSVAVLRCVTWTRGMTIWTVMTMTIRTVGGDGSPSPNIGCLPYGVLLTDSSSLLTYRLFIRLRYPINLCYPVPEMFIHK